MKSPTARIPQLRQLVEAAASVVRRGSSDLTLSPLRIPEAVDLVFGERVSVASCRRMIFREATQRLAERFDVSPSRITLAQLGRGSKALVAATEEELDRAQEEVERFDAEGRDAWKKSVVAYFKAGGDCVPAANGGAA